ncbi:dihydrolipoyl dehydrogenase [Brevibacillus agri]|uniref:dihydrolipoyl dehydrogenase n=1 Tax=Paenibacillaceae TaxID=186822 RepID=UPI000418109A|nr:MULTISPECIES: dihydrolipoyl dehydrogenase [Brevibacillus]MED1646633.1 dihydrolipoyl dehydrogenase [Brevibacillus agri]MED1657381.1 dihydrolipoyl dehydrogenase [Brevibacillus agri]MED1688163.1 dihydrolipoyl dehydrogenase [Brevibacillus agri]MED1695408.1 dihydrolipoyl dehydrogenase [Brevibacillus agri]MED1699070.1 dihydrolipoyl dehydrogenase [Brevibacillus agri]
MVVGDAIHHTQLLVIGGGSGGYVAAIRAAQLGKKVVLVEKSEMGGVCLNCGCIPSKALISAAHRYEHMRNSGISGLIANNVEIDFAQIQHWKQSDVVNRLKMGIHSLMKKHKITVFKGEAVFINEREARVYNEQETLRYRFDHCIVAVGSRPIELKPFPYGGRILSSTEALSLTEIPQRLIVIGGGYIGIELGQMYAKFGSQVTVLEGTPTILPGFEKDITRIISKHLDALGTIVYTEAMAQSAAQTDKDITVTFTVNNEQKQVTADYVLVTVGRRPNTDGELGLDRIGVKIGDRGLVEVDQQGRTSIPHIHAIGDIIPGPALAHKASYEGKVVAEAIAGLPSAFDYKVIPAVVFSDPEIASVGLSESEAKEQGFEVMVGKFPFAANARALSLTAPEGFVKLVGDKKTGLILGGQIVGTNASDLIPEIALAIEMGATMEDLALTIHAHPTLGELSAEAAEVALGHPIHI